MVDEQKPKNGISVKELESFTKKHRFEVFFCLSLLLSGFFNIVFFEGWGTIAAVIGGILGILFPAKVSVFLDRFRSFFRKQEDLTKLILAVAGLVLSIFLPILTFFTVGIAAGEYFLRFKDDSPE